jgi:hypothetical protein
MIQVLVHVGTENGSWEEVVVDVDTDDELVAMLEAPIDALPRLCEKIGGNENHLLMIMGARINREIARIIGSRMEGQ